MTTDTAPTSSADAWTLTPHQVAQQLGMNKDTIVSWADKGKLPCLRTPAGHRRFRQSDIDAFVALGRT